MNQFKKFRKIGKSDPLYIGDGFFSNRHWLFRADWIQSMKTRVTLGLRKALERKQVEYVTARMQGAEVPSVNLGKLVNELNFDNYQKIDMTKPIATRLGFRKRAVTESVTAFILKNGKKEIGVDPLYISALFFDPEAEIFIRDGESPIAIRKNGELIGLLMPIRLKKENE